MAFHYWKNRGRPGKTELRLPRRRLSRRDAGRARGHRRARFSATPTRRCCTGNATVPSPGLRARPQPGESPRDVAARAAQALEAHLAEHHATTAALIVEPLVQGASGMAMYDAHYLARARELCTRYGVLLIADEIMTGFGRTGTLFACEQAGIAPDFLCLSKGITGGYLPLSCVLDDRRRLRRVLRRRRRARVPAFALVHRQRARLPRGAGRARHLPRRRRASPPTATRSALDGARGAARRASAGSRISAIAA